MEGKAVEKSGKKENRAQVRSFPCRRVQSLPLQRSEEIQGRGSKGNPCCLVFLSSKKVDVNNDLLKLKGFDGVFEGQKKSVNSPRLSLLPFTAILLSDSLQTVHFLCLPFIGLWVVFTGIKREIQYTSSSLKCSHLFPGTQEIYLLFHIKSEKIERGYNRHKNNKQIS